MGTGPAGSVFRGNSFYRETRLQDEGGRHVAKGSSDPTPGSLPRSQSSGTGPSVSCGYCCPLCPAGVSIRGKFVLSRYPGYKMRGSPCG